MRSAYALEDGEACLAIISLARDEQVRDEWLPTKKREEVQIQIAQVNDEQTQGPVRPAALPALELRRSKCGELTASMKQLCSPMAFVSCAIRSTLVTVYNRRP